MPIAVRRLVLANGLQVVLRHAAHLKRSAAAVRVLAGSHDAPRHWPGMAHFLEHLLFLGTGRFPLDDGLMRHVQRQGGLVNASTRERTTDYFFEVPPAALDDCLERLGDMLARPLLDTGRQLREREVIHAEFIAWSRNAEAQQQYALLQRVSPRHPLSGFHAGNRFSLPVHNPAFQAALSGFHRDHYQGGRMQLSLCGPQSLERLEAFARTFGELFVPGPAPLRANLPPLAGQATEGLFACDGLPAGTAQAIAFLDTWLEDASLVPLYLHEGQALLHLKTESPHVLGWLAFLRNADLTALNREFGRLQRAREQAASALELARQDMLGTPFAPLDSEGLTALRALLDAMLTGKVPSAGDWSLPAPEPLLELMGNARSHGVLYLRWQVGPDTWKGLEQALRPLKRRAARIAAALEFSECADFRQLHCAGAPAVVLALVSEVFNLLTKSSSTLPQTHLVPIRALLKALPEAIVGQPPASPAPPVWQAMARGFDDKALGDLLSRAPGQAGDHRARPVVQGRQWHQAAPGDSENALLLFCPLPLAEEAAGRLVAQQLQGPFYQRMRVELQLGYAVFSTFRQVQGQGGLLFGIQSPGASHAELLTHIEAFFSSTCADLSLDENVRQALAEQFDPTSMADAEQAEWIWQRQLAGNPGATAETFKSAVLAISPADVCRVAQQLQAATYGWLCLANGPAPDTRWQCRLPSMKCASSNI